MYAHKTQSKIDKFELNESFLRKYAGGEPNWGWEGLSKFTFMSRYSRPLDPENPNSSPNESFFEMLSRMVNGTYTMQKKWIVDNGLGWNSDKAQRSAQEMFERIWQFKFTPPGRGFWAMGTPLTEDKGLYAALNNCFARETEIITRNGIKEIGDLAGRDVTVLSENGQWVDAPVRSFGEQPLRKITLRRQGVEKTIHATPYHVWYAKTQSDVNHSKGFSEVETDDLEEGSRLRYQFGQGTSQLRPSPQGIQHGFTYGDGTIEVNSAVAVLCGEKDQEMSQYFPQNPKTNGTEGQTRVADLPKYYKDLPSMEEGGSYLYGWAAGYFAADGSVDRNGGIYMQSADRQAIERFRDVAAILGIGVYDIREETRESNLTGEDHTMYSVNLVPETVEESFFLISAHRENFDPDKYKRHWNVVSVEETDRVEEVYCATVPDSNNFTLAGNILTHNCAFTSTKDIASDDPSKSFRYLMDMSMLGVGVGFDTKGVGTRRVQGIGDTTVQHTVPDSREGWVESIGQLIENFITGGPQIDFDYSEIRPRGEPIKGFGGTASGPDPLKRLHNQIREGLSRNAGDTVSTRTVVDIMNQIGQCVIAGNVRRTAEIAFADPSNEEFLDLKDYDKNPERQEYGWASNNSIFAEVGQGYFAPASRTAANGEPGYAWLENMRKYGRMKDPINNDDRRAEGGNPCLEQTLEDKELCTLVETYPNHHDSKKDYHRTLKFAYLYAKTVTLGQVHWAESNRVMQRNRRIGTSVTGVTQFTESRGLGELQEWLDEGYDVIQEYDRIYSEWMAVPRSVKTTSVKPSGTVSILAGATPGMHWPEHTTYIRRIRLQKGSELLPPIREAGYPVEPDEADDSSMVVEFPVQIEEDMRTVDEVSMWEQLSMAAFLQREWADNQVSSTISFDATRANDEVADEIARALEYFQFQLKGVSFLPKFDMSGDGGGAYAQLPYEPIDQEEYERRAEDVDEIDFSSVTGSEPEIEKFCSGKSCTVDLA
jgi:ribonucleotide reductase alpha subunit